MENQNEPDFTFGDDDNVNYTVDADNKKFDKLTQKVTLLSILMPCVLGLLLLFLYFDMNKKVGQVNSSGSAQVSDISKELETTISDIKAKSDSFEKSLNAKIAKLDKSIASINKSLKKAEKNISFITYSKINKKQFNADLKKINGTTTQLKADIDSVARQNAQLTIIAEQLKDRTNELDSLKKSIGLLQTDLAQTTGSLVSKSELDDILKKQKRLFQLEIKDNYNKMTKKIALLKFERQTESKATEVID